MLLVQATLPSLIFFAGRLNNDVLSAFLGLLTLSFILRFWHGNRLRDLSIACILAALHLLTKNTGLLFVPLIGFCILCQHGVSFRKKLAHGALALLIIILLAGWLSALRIWQDRDASLIVGNVGNLNSALSLPNSVAAFTTFNPIAILHHPYNNPWNDEARRANFWEYLLRSAFTGEFNTDKTRAEFMRLISRSNPVG